MRLFFNNLDFPKEILENVVGLALLDFFLKINASLVRHHVQQIGKAPWYV